MFAADHLMLAHHRQAAVGGIASAHLTHFLITVGAANNVSPCQREWVTWFLQEVAEGDFLKVVTETRRVVVHFFHREFTRCKIMDKHLATLTHRFFSTRFVKVSALVRRVVYPLF